MPVSRLNTLDLPTFGLPASARPVGISRFQRAISPWQESTRYAFRTRMRAATSRPSA